MTEKSNIMSGWMQQKSEHWRTAIHLRQGYGGQDGGRGSATGRHDRHLNQPMFNDIQWYPMILAQKNKKNL
jgi:hypothetical protein